jgi:hypothetical protein
MRSITTGMGNKVLAFHRRRLSLAASQRINFLSSSSHCLHLPLPVRVNNRAGIIHDVLFPTLRRDMPVNVRGTTRTVRILISGQLVTYQHKWERHNLSCFITSSRTMISHEGKDICQNICDECPNTHRIHEINWNLFRVVNMCKGTVSASYGVRVPSTGRDASATLSTCNGRALKSG